jgi:hypothetical protein
VKVSEGEKIKKIPPEMDANASWTTTYVIILYTFCVLLRPVHFWLPLFRPVFFVARFPPVAAVKNPPGGMRGSEKSRRRHADGGDWDDCAPPESRLLLQGFL